MVRSVMYSLLSRFFVKLLVVEAPGKVKAISQYVGPDYKVLATWGHVRSLPSKTGSVRPDEDFGLTWEMTEKAEKAVGAIVKALEKADTLILATDLDREGEAISWHLLEHLKEIKALKKDLIIQRVCFNAITKPAILQALSQPRQVDNDLVDAYLARLSLDYLVGFTLSPILWTKVPGTRSAGRVQSVALRLVVEKEQNIRSFQIQEYWSIHGFFDQEKKGFSAQLGTFRGQKLEKLSLKTEDEAKEWVTELQPLSYTVKEVTAKRVQRHPAPPFITSSLQQEASRKLGYSPSRTMQIAQKLYEGVEVDGQTLGLITYMRTDSTMIIPEVIKDIRAFVTKKWGAEFISPAVRQYKVKAHSQEAHEAVRPTHIDLTPDGLKSILPPDLLPLYKLIWDRTMASQMSSAQYDQTTANIVSSDGQHIFRASGSVLVFEGFLILYGESVDDDADQDDLKKLPALTADQTVVLERVNPDQHFTQPPARYSEASLIKGMEELGIGRPSTYARTLQVLQERGYVEIDKKRMVPKERGMVVTAFLCKFFAKYVDYNFTADLENQLDQVSAGKESWKNFLRQFWNPFFNTIQESKSLKVSEVLDIIQEDILEQPKQECPRCKKGFLSLKLGKIGPFLACSDYPDCTYSANIEGASEEPSVLGAHPDTGKDILIKKGPFGWYVEHAETRTSLAPLFTPENVQLDQALWLLSLPHELGKHPKTDLPIMIGLGRFGPYVKYQNRFYSIKQKQPDTLTLHQAVDLIDHAPAPKKPVADKPEMGTKTGPVKTAVAKKTAAPVKTSPAKTDALAKSPVVKSPVTKKITKSLDSVPSDETVAKPVRSKTTPAASRAKKTAAASPSLEGSVSKTSEKTPSEPEV
jgi:DNA topoisomerase-1